MLSLSLLISKIRTTGVCYLVSFTVVHPAPGKVFSMVVGALLLFTKWMNEMTEKSCLRYCVQLFALHLQKGTGGVNLKHKNN